MKTNDEKCSGGRPHVPYLPTPILEMVLIFLDLPTIGSFAQASKRFNEVAHRDSVWSSHLQLLLKELYDNCRRIGGGGEGDNVLPLSKRPLKSTELVGWCNDHYKRILRSRATTATEITQIPLLNVLQNPLLADKAKLSPSRRQMLFWKEDVPCYECYCQAAGWAIWAEFQYHTFEMPAEDKCLVCLTNDDDDDDGCLCGHYVMDRFRDVLWNQVLHNLPSIRLFRVLPNMADQTPEDFFNRWPSY